MLFSKSYVHWSFTDAIFEDEISEQYSNKSVDASMAFHVQYWLPIYIEASAKKKWRDALKHTVGLVSFFYSKLLLKIGKIQWTTYTIPIKKLDNVQLD